MTGTRLLFLLAVAALLVPGCRKPAVPSPDPPAAPAEASAAALFRFDDVAEASGLRHRWGPRGKELLTNLESFGCGCAFWDFDQDGWLDILLVSEPACVLYRSVPGPAGGRRFRDVTREAGLHRVRGPWKGCAVGDWDGDGRPDLFLGGYHTAALLRNVDGRRFVDRTRESGIRHRGWASSAGFADYDGDGDLDLYVGNYVRFGPDSVQHCRFREGTVGGCPPRVYPAEYGVLYRNEGGGGFLDATRATGLSAASGKVLALGWADYDDDGDQDLYLANDGVTGDLFRNDGGRFTNVGILSGTAFGVSHMAQAGMGVDWGDFDRSGTLDLVVTAFSDESYSLYRNGGGLFDNVSTDVGLAEPTFKPLGFGCRFIDVDNDGWLDLVFANGHVYTQAEKLDPLSPYRQTTQVLRNVGGRRYVDVSREAGPAFQRRVVGRGLALGDYDNDGRQDLLLVDYEGGPMLLRNTTESPHHALRLRLEGPPGNRLAYGARITARVGGRIFVAEVNPSMSYLSSSDPRVYIGLGGATSVDRLEVRWPDGRRERFTAPADQETALAYGRGSVEAGAGGRDGG